jgi:hypothetical protein
MNLLPFASQFPNSVSYISKHSGAWIRNLYSRFIVSALRPYSLAYLLLELSPSGGAANSAATEEFLSILWNPKVLPCSQEPPLVPILSQINPIHTIRSYRSKIHFNIVHPLRLGLPSGLFPSGFPTNILRAFLVYPIRSTCPAHLILLDWLF